MTAALESSFNFANLQGLQSLREAGDTPEARRAIARQFESLFLNLMISQMRSASSVIDGGLIDNSKLETQRSMLDQQLALSLSRGRGIGIADSILRSLGDPAGDVLPQSGTSSLPLPRAQVTSAALSARQALNPAAAETPLNAEATGAQTAPDIKGVETPFSAESPEAFVRSLWPHAERAASRLGITPDALIAQAALETGWGTSLPANQYGETSFNLFGIKAGSDWIGPRAVVTTLEFEGGVPEKRQAAFRMYSDIAASFDDYVALVSGKDRYREAVEARTPAAYFRGLQDGGYATDPDYADKLIGILDRGLPGRPERQVAAAAADNTVNGGRL